MSNYARILVAIDPLGEYQSIVERTKAVADSNAKISILHVHEPFVYIDMRYADTDAETEVVEQARQVIEKIGVELNVPAERRYVEQGKPAKVIHQKCEELEIDLVIMGTHGRHGVQLLLGSTANAVLHGTQCDVLAIRVSDAPSN